MRRHIGELASIVALVFCVAACGGDTDYVGELEPIDTVEDSGTVDDSVTAGGRSRPWFGRGGRIRSTTSSIPTTVARTSPRSRCTRGRG